MFSLWQRWASIVKLTKSEFLTVVNLVQGLFTHKHDCFCWMLWITLIKYQQYLYLESPLLLVMSACCHLVVLLQVSEAKKKKKEFEMLLASPIWVHTSELYTFPLRHWDRCGTLPARCPGLGWLVFCAMVLSFTWTGCGPGPSLPDTYRHARDTRHAAGWPDRTQELVYTRLTLFHKNLY